MMTAFDAEQLAHAARHARGNDLSVKRSTHCACYCCEHQFDAKKVVEWTPEDRDGKINAICPNCGVDSVIGDASGIAINEPLLTALNERYFS